MHHQSAPPAEDDHRSTGIDPFAAPVRSGHRSFAPALVGLVLLGTSAACATERDVGRNSSVSVTAATEPVATPATAPAPAPVATPTTVAVTAPPAGDNWGAIEADLARDGRVCSSARFGTGPSDQPPAEQTFTSQADQLHDALQSVGEPGPYVLAGHSFGGAEAVAFASMFRDRVSGLLLIDASPTTWPEAVCAVADDGSDVARSFHESCTIGFLPEGNAERLDVRAAFAEVATITSLGALPMVVVAADAKAYPGLDAGEAARLNDVWTGGQERWAALSSAGHVVTVAGAGHYVHLDRPAVVIEHLQDLSR